MCRQNASKRLIPGIVALVLAGVLDIEALPCIQEVLYDGPSSDADDVFTEIAGPAGTSLDGWTLVGINGGTGTPYRTVDLTGAVIPADGVLVVATAQAEGEVLAQRDFSAEVDWQNGPDAVQLRDSLGEVVDALQYGDAGTFNAGEGSPAPMVSAGQSLTRDTSGTDTDDNAADFTPGDTPTPGIGPTSPSTDLVVSVPDTTAVYGDTIDLPVRISDTSGQDIVALEMFLSYDGDLLTAISVDLSLSLLTLDWGVTTHIVESVTSPIDTLKVVMATGDRALQGAGNLLAIRLAVAAQRQPAETPLLLEHFLCNAGIPTFRAESGRFRVVGNNAEISVDPEQLTPPSSLLVRVEDGDADLDPEIQDMVQIRAEIGAEEFEVFSLLETGPGTGIFTDSVEVESGTPAPEDGVLQCGTADRIDFFYDDLLDRSGQTSMRQATVDLRVGSDGRLSVTAAVQPGDSLWVLIVDPDLNAAPEAEETVEVAAYRSAIGDSETLTLAETGVDDGAFVGFLPTTPDSSADDDGRLTAHRGDTLQVSYIDTLNASGWARKVSGAARVVGLFGDVDTNGQVQAFDAARVMRHVLFPFLADLDSLAANVDSLAPFGPITSLDAALIMQHRVGLLFRFPVQGIEARNHPKFPDQAPAARPFMSERRLVLQPYPDHLSVWIDERSGIIAGDLIIAGMSGRVVLGEELRHFLTAWRRSGDDLRVLLAGAVPVAGPGELLRVYGENAAAARLVSARFNDGLIPVRTAVETATGLPSGFVLHPNYPNPFNPQTAICFDLPEESVVTLEIFDLLGRYLRLLVAEKLPASSQQVVWDGRDERGRAMSSGLYFYRLRAGDFQQTRRMLLLR